MTKREQILSLVKEYYEETFGTSKDFVPGDRIDYGGRVFDNEEMHNLIDASLDFWLTSGRYTEQFQKEFARLMNVKYCLVTASGSSSNLLAFMALTSPLLKERAIQRSDEIITVAAGFPTTVTPAIQFGAVPVFVDVTIPDYNIDCSLLEKALSPKTKAVIIAHTLGNPFDLQAVKSFCDKNGLWLIEDNCDALGAKYYIDGEWKYTGTIGDIGTSSFYPPHHITMGEGGAVYTNNALLKRILASLRDWGRDCYCSSGRDNTCTQRFSQQHGELPFGYDHKYVYSHFGYNLKVTDMQVAIGCAQLKKLHDFVETRRKNWEYLYEQLADLSSVFYLPKATENSKPSWFGFLLTIKPNMPFKRVDIVQHLESRNIQTRLLFSGNLIKHPCFDTIRGNDAYYRVVGDLKNSDIITENTFWIGVYPGMKPGMLTYMADEIKSFVNTYK